MRAKTITASLLLLLSTSSYAMESAFIAEEPGNQCASTKPVCFDAFSPLHRFLNDDFVSNLRFLYGSKQWDPLLSGHSQSILNNNFPTDSMTQFAHLLFPSPMGDYLVANQSTDIIAKTKASKFYAALVGMRTNGALDVWGLFELLFDRQLSSFAKEIIIAENNNFCIESYANAVKKEAAQHQTPIDKIIKHLQEDDFFQDGFLASKEGKLFKTALKGGNPAWQRIQETLLKKRKNLTDTLKNLKADSLKKPKMEAELAELSKLDENFVTKHDLQGYQIANTFVNAFIQEQSGAYSAGTIDRIIATYMWQKAETVGDLPFLSGTLLTDHDMMKERIKPLIANPGLAQSYYDAGHYDVIWAHIYREKLMLDAKHVPITKYRTTTVDEHSIPDCFETAMHNGADFFCFKDGSFDPTVWKEGSPLRKYFTEFKHTTPNDAKARSKWATAVAKKPGVLYYTPSKKMNDTTNTVEAVPGIINMFKIMAHLGNATAATWEHIAGLEALSEASAQEQLSASFRLLMTDLTSGSVVFDHASCSSTDRISDRIAGNNDFTGTFYVIVKDRLPFEWQFMHKHSIFKYDAPTQECDNNTMLTLSRLPLFTALIPHYADLKTLITPEMTQSELTKLLMESDLRSPDLRREIMPILLESHLDLPLLKNILKQIEKEHDDYESREIGQIFNKNLNAWLDDPIKRPMVMDLIRSAPKFFSEQLGPDSVEHGALYKKLLTRSNDEDALELATDLMQKASSFSFDIDVNLVYSYIHFFKSIKSLYNLPLFDKEGALFDFTKFNKLERIGFSVSNSTEIQPLSTEQINEFVQKMASSINHVSFSNINTRVQLSNTYAIFNKMKETRTELDLGDLHTNIAFNQLIGLKDSEPALLEWVAPKITRINDMSFLQHEDQMQLFTHIETVSNFVIANKDGTLNRSLFTKLNRFNKLTSLDLSLSKWDQSIPDDISDSTSLDVIVDQLPRSLQNISLCNLSFVKWDDLESFVEMLATKRPNLRIYMWGSRSILEAHPRMMTLVESGRITTN